MPRVLDQLANRLGYIPKPVEVVEKTAQPREALAQNPLAQAYKAMSVQSGLRKATGITMQTLRRMSRANWVDRSCIFVLRDEIAALPWDVVPIDPHKPYDAVFQQIRVDLLNRPNRNNENFRTLWDKMLEDIPPQVLWRWWAGPGTPDLAVLWRAYVRRFDLEHTFRFLKQTLNWTTPRVRHPEQADHWTLLVLAAYTQLRLARGIVADQRLPWERPLPRGRLTPYRAQRTFSALLPHLGSLASAPKPCGRSPGRPKGRLSGVVHAFRRSNAAHEHDVPTLFERKGAST